MKVKPLITKILNIVSTIAGVDKRFGKEAEFVEFGVTSFVDDPSLPE